MRNEETGERYLGIDGVGALTVDGAFEFAKRIRMTAEILLAAEAFLGT